MAGRSGFRVEGLAQVVRDLQALGLDVDDLKGAFSALAREGAELAARAAPKRSGRLAASVRGNRAKGQAVVAAGGATVPYAGAINYGWQARNIAPAGFMQSASEALEPKAVEQLEHEINRIIKSKGLNQ